MQQIEQRKNKIKLYSKAKLRAKRWNVKIKYEMFTKYYLIGWRQAVVVTVGWSCSSLGTGGHG